MLNEQLIDFQQQKRENDRLLDDARRPIRNEYQKLSERRDLWLAALKLAVLIPVLLVVLWLYLKRRDSIYAPLIYAAGIAVAVKVMQVMYEDFPERYFKYILILTSLAIVIWIDAGCPMLDNRRTATCQHLASSI